MRQSIMQRLVLLGITLLVSGCLGSGLNLDFLKSDSVRMTPEHTQFIKTAGVVSFVDVQPRVHFVSSSFKESNLESMVFDDWDANATITELMEKRLRQKGFTVIPVDARIPLADAYSSSASFAEPDRLRNRLILAGKRAGVDMLVVVYRQLTRDFITKSSQKVLGYGLYKRHNEDGVYTYGSVYVEVLNVNKGYVLGKANGTVKLDLDSTAWQQNFETDEGPIRLSRVHGDYVRAKVVEALTTATMIAAQETGVSN